MHLRSQSLAKACMHLLHDSQTMKSATYCSHENECEVDDIGREDLYPYDEHDKHYTKQEGQK